MEYLAPSLETLALQVFFKIIIFLIFKATIIYLQVILKAGLATDRVSPTAKMEVAAWRRLEGTYALVDMELEVLTKEGGEVTGDQWDFGSLSGFSFIPEKLPEIIQIENFCGLQGVKKCCDCGCLEDAVLSVSSDGATFFDVFFEGDFSYCDFNENLSSCTEVICQEAFEDGRLRLSNYITWTRTKGGLEEEMKAKEVEQFVIYILLMMLNKRRRSRSYIL